MALTIVVETTGEFVRDVAHYHVPDDSVERISAHLAADPSRGDGAEALRHWSVGGWRVSYSFHVVSAEKALVILLRIRPAEEPRGRLTKRAKELLDLAGRIKGLATGW